MNEIFLCYNEQMEDEMNVECCRECGKKNCFQRLFFNLHRKKCCRLKQRQIEFIEEQLTLLNDKVSFMDEMFFGIEDRIDALHSLITNYSTLISAQITEQGEIIMSRLDDLGAAIDTLAADVAAEAGEVHARLDELQAMIDALNAGAVSQEEIDALTAKVRDADAAVTHIVDVAAPAPAPEPAPEG